MGLAATAGIGGFGICCAAVPDDNAVVPYRGEAQASKRLTSPSVIACLRGTGLD
jgi:hypothetical protein